MFTKILSVLFVSAIVAVSQATVAPTVSQAGLGFDPTAAFLSQPANDPSAAGAQHANDPAVAGSGFGITPAVTGADVSAAQRPAGDELDLICGTLDYDGVDALPAYRGPDGSGAWTLARCVDTQCSLLLAITWVATEESDDAWTGESDFAVWEAAKVESGCADETNALLIGTAPATRTPLLDDNGQQVRILGRNAWIYRVDTGSFGLCSEYEESYVAVRNVTRSGKSYVATRPCSGDLPVFFLSPSMGYDCAVPGRDVFGADYCVSVKSVGFWGDGGGCLGRERIRKATCKRKCRDGQVRKTKVKVNLSGGNSFDGFCVTLDTDEQCCGTLNVHGKARCRFQNVPLGLHTATAEWDCGATDEKTFTCRKCN